MAAATGMLGLTLVARRAFAEPEVIDLVDEQPEIDLTASTGHDADGPIAQMS